MEKIDTLSFLDYSEYTNEKINMMSLNVLNNISKSISVQSNKLVSMFDDYDVVRGMIIKKIKKLDVYYDHHKNWENLVSLDNINLNNYDFLDIKCLNLEFIENLEKESLDTFYKILVKDLSVLSTLYINIEKIKKNIIKKIVKEDTELNFESEFQRFVIDCDEVDDELDMIDSKMITKEKLTIFNENV